MCVLCAGAVERIHLLCTQNFLVFEEVGILIRIVGRVFRNDLK